MRKGYQSHVFVAMGAQRLKSSLYLQDVREGLSQESGVGCTIVRRVLGEQRPGGLKMPCVLEGQP